jgi:hypothetical protein
MNPLNGKGENETVNNSQREEKAKECYNLCGNADCLRFGCQLSSSNKLRAQDAYAQYAESQTVVHKEENTEGDHRQFEKPDFEKLADRKCPPKAYPEAWGGFVAACDHVWSTYVVPLQETIDSNKADSDKIIEKLLNQVRVLTLIHEEDSAENKALKDEQEEWQSWENGADLAREVDVKMEDGSILMNCNPQADSDFYYTPFNRFITISEVKQWRFSKENIYD